MEDYRIFFQKGISYLSFKDEWVEIWNKYRSRWWECEEIELFVDKRQRALLMTKRTVTH